MASSPDAGYDASPYASAYSSIASGSGSVGASDRANIYPQYFQSQHNNIISEHCLSACLTRDLSTECADAPSPFPADNISYVTHSIDQMNVRSESPASAGYPQNPMCTSAGEVKEENSLAAIEDQVNQAASEIRQGESDALTPVPPSVDQSWTWQHDHQQSAHYGPSQDATAGDCGAFWYPPGGQYQYAGYQAGWGSQDGHAYYQQHQQALGMPPQGYEGYYDPSMYPNANAYAGNSNPNAAYYGMEHATGQHPAPPQSLSSPPGVMFRQSTTLSKSSNHSGSIDSRRRSKENGLPQQTLPFNKDFVNEYRARMKADPDPEEQFRFARYLIEAAKKIQDPADGPKQARKYRDLLLSESLKLVKRLATTGMGLGKPPYAEAQFFLANCFGNGSLGLQVDHEKAYNLYVQASKQNHPAATYRTAVCNEVGAGTRRDHHRAVLFYRKASALGDTAGMYKLGMILLNGLLGQPRNVREAIVWLKRAAGQADEDNPHALHELGLLHQKPHPAVPHDEAYSRELFTQAAQLGYAPSQFKLGSAYEYGALTCPVDPRRSIAWYTKAAGKNDGESELALSGWYLTGSEGVLKQSDAEAYLWARRAASKGIPKAEYAVGYYSEVGIGVKADLEEAKKWYMRAAAQGNKRAMQRLTELKRMGAKAGKARPTRGDAEKECVVM